MLTEPRPASDRGDDRQSLAIFSKFGGKLTATGILFRCLDRRKQRRELANLDDRLLRDIGISRAEAAREAAKPFWR